MNHGLARAWTKVDGVHWTKISLVFFCIPAGGLMQLDVDSCELRCR